MSAVTPDPDLPRSDTRPYSARHLMWVCVAAALIVLVVDLFVKGSVILSPAEFIDDIQLSARYMQAPHPSGNLGLRAFSTMVHQFQDMNAVQLVLQVMLAIGLGCLSGALYVATGSRTVALGTALLYVTFPSNYIIGVFANGSYNSQFIFWFGIAALLFARVVTARADRWALPFVGLGSAALVLATLVTTNGLFVPLLLSVALALHLWMTPRSRLSLRLAASLGSLLVAAAIYLYLATYSHPYAGMSGRLTESFAELFLNANRITGNLFSAYWKPIVITGKVLENYPYTLGLVVNLAIGLGVMAGLGLALRARRPARPLVLTALAFVAFVLSVAPLALSRITHIWHYQLPALFFGVTLLLALNALPWGRAARILSIALVAGVSLAGLASLQEYGPAYSRDAANQAILGAFLSERAERLDGQPTTIVFDRLKIPVSGMNWPYRFPQYVSDHAAFGAETDLVLLRTSETEKVAERLESEAMNWYLWIEDAVVPATPEQVRAAVGLD